MSSLRNSIQRRSHRERAQPRERQRLGMLEKHKDYSLRAADYNKKKQQLKNLRQKAADRNEDEFYFGMLSRKGPSSLFTKGRRWTGTVEGDRGNRSMDVDTVRIMKTQDMGYVRTVRNVFTKEARKLEEQILLAGASLDGLDGGEDDSEDDDVPRQAAKPPRKIVFVDTPEEREQVIQNRKPEEEDADMDSEFEGFDDKEESPEAAKAKAIRKLQTQLKNVRKKLRVLTDAENGLEEQRAKMAKTATSGGFTKKGKKIMVRTRKR